VGSVCTVHVCACAAPPYVVIYYCHILHRTECHYHSRLHSSTWEAPEELSANEFTAGSVLSLTCMALGGSGDLTYSWSLQGNPTPSGCGSNCPTPTSSTATLTVGPPLLSYYAGTYTCTVSESGRPSSGNSDSHTVTVVGECHGVCACVCSVQ